MAQRAANLAAMFTDRGGEEAGGPARFHADGSPREAGRLFPRGGTVLVANMDGRHEPITAAVMNSSPRDGSRAAQLRGPRHRCGSGCHARSADAAAGGSAHRAGGGLGNFAWSFARVAGAVTGDASAGDASAGDTSAGKDGRRNHLVTTGGTPRLVLALLPCPCRRCACPWQRSRPPRPCSAKPDSRDRAGPLPTAITPIFVILGRSVSRKRIRGATRAISPALSGEDGGTSSRHDRTTGNTSASQQRFESFCGTRGRTPTLRQPTGLWQSTTERSTDGAKCCKVKYEPVSDAPNTSLTCRTATARRTGNPGRPQRFPHRAGARGPDWLRYCPGRFTIAPIYNPDTRLKHAHSTSGHATCEGGSTCSR